MLQGRKFMAGVVRPFSRTLTAVCLAGLGWAFSFGLGAPLAALWMRDSGCSAKIVGLNTSIYFLGAAAAALWAPSLMKRFGRWCITGGILVDALCTALFPLSPGLTLWFLLRLFGGVASAVCLIPMETLINHNASSERRARDFGIYALCVALGVGLGTLVGLPLYGWSPRLAFALGGLAALPAVLIAHWGLPGSIGATEEESHGARPSLMHNRLSLGASWVQGFLEGGMITFLSIHLLTLGYAEAQVGGLMAALFLGVVLFQTPSAWLADRFGRLRVLAAFHGILLLGLACLPFCTGPVAVGGWLFVVGGCCAALYPLGLALLGERTAPAALARANAWYLACNCVGSLTGPCLIGAAIDFFHSQAALFAVGVAAVAAVLAFWAAGALAAGSTDESTANNHSGQADPPRRMAG
jgi:MFS family permease